MPQQLQLRLPRHAGRSVEWNYQSAVTLQQAGKIPYTKGELPGLSVFLRNGDRLFHTYSTYGRGLDMLLGVYHYLDLTPFGRGEGWGGMPDLDQQGQQGWLLDHGKYGREVLRESDACCHSGEDRG